MYKSPGGLVKNADSGSLGLGWDLGFYISNKLTGDANATVTQTTL